MVFVEELTPIHHRNKFDCGKPAVNAFLHQQNVGNVGNEDVLVALDSRYPTVVLGFVAVAYENILWDGFTVSERMVLDLEGGPCRMALIHYIGVGKERQRMGLGTLLIECVLAHLENRGIKKNALLAEAVYEDTRPVFPRLGFVPLGEDSPWMLMRL